MVDDAGPVGVLSQVGIDVKDLDRSAEFWMGLLGLEVASRSDSYLMFEKQGGGPGLYLQKVPEEKTAKTRLHLDIAVKDLDAAAAKAKALGATEVSPRFDEEGGHWVVMEDPDGNEFCLVL